MNWYLSLVFLANLSLAVAVEDTVLSPDDDQSKSDSIATVDAASTEPINRINLMKLLSNDGFDEAIARVDAAIAEKPNDSALANLDLTLAIGLMRSKPEAAKRRLADLVERTLAHERLDVASATALSAACNYLVQMTPDRGPDEA